MKYGIQLIFQIIGIDTDCYHNIAGCSCQSIHNLKMIINILLIESFLFLR